TAAQGGVGPWRVRLCRPPERHRSEGSLIAQGRSDPDVGACFLLVTSLCRAKRSNSPWKGEIFTVGTSKNSSAPNSKAIRATVDGDGETAAKPGGRMAKIAANAGAG